MEAHARTPCGVLFAILYQVNTGWRRREINHNLHWLCFVLRNALGLVFHRPGENWLQFSMNVLQLTRSDTINALIQDNCTRHKYDLYRENLWSTHWATTYNLQLTHMWLRARLPIHSFVRHTLTFCRNTHGRNRWKISFFCNINSRNPRWLHRIIYLFRLHKMNEARGEDIKSKWISRSEMNAMAMHEAWHGGFWLWLNAKNECLNSPL